MKVHTYAFGALGGNCYLCTNDEGTDGILIDPVAPPDYVLKKQNNNLKIHYILITHCHFDHLLAYETWHTCKIAPTAIMADDAPGLLTPAINLNAAFYGTQIAYSKADMLLTDGQILTFGDCSVKVIATPGHTAGSCCYLVDKILFSGDTIFAGGNYGRYDFPTGDGAALFASIRKLCTLGDDITVYPGHGEKDKMKNIKSVLG